MKKLNLIKRLWTDSHEKQSPQRFARYAAMLILLLTLGVGQAWGTYYWSAATSSNNGNSWGATAMTQSEDGFYWYYKITSAKPGGNDGFKIRASNSNWDTSYGYSNVSTGFNGTNITDSWNNSDGNAHFYDSGANYYIIFYPSNTINTTGSPIICAATYLPDNRSCTVYYVNTNSWSGTLHAYGWFYDGANGRNATWPGANMTNTGKTYNGKAIWSYTYANSYPTIIFNNKSGDSGNQTADITMGYSANGKMYTSTWVTLAYDVKLDQQSGSGGTSSIIATCGSAMPSSETAPSRTGYTFGGYYTGTNGNGTHYYTSTMASAATWPSDGTGPTTLYAKWTANTYTITLNGNGGTGHTASVTATYNSSTLASITNPERSGYTFAGWYTNSDGTGTMLISPDGYLTWNIGGFTDASGKWIATTGTNLYARWKTNASVNTYNFQYGSGTFYSSSWTLLNFGDADANNMRTVDWTLINPASQKFYVGYNGDYQNTSINGGGESSEKDLTTLRLAPGTLSVGTATGAVGKLVIFDNSSADNLYVGFQPNGYGLTYAGGTKAFSEVGDNMWQTDIVTLTAADVAGTFKVGLATATSGTYVDCSAMTTSDGAEALNTRKDALVSEQGYPAIPDLADGQEGRFVIWDNDSHTGKQWYLSFLPVYSITYNANGAETGTAPTDANKYRTNETPTVLGNSGNLAKQGYAFSGWNTEADGSGTAYAAGDNLAKIGSNVTLYAQFEKAEITALRLSETVIAPNETITVTPTIEPTPTGTTKVCYELQYSNGTALPSQPTFTPVAGNAVSFPVPSASATYRIQAKLAKGSTCPANPADVLSTRTTTFQVAGAHTVTIRYQDSDGRTLQASASIEASPLNWTTDGNITPPTITGYTFVRWDAGDGVSIKNGVSDPVTTTTTPSIQIKAVYDGTLTAVYNKKNMIFFNNTLGWSDVYVYFYSSDKYWVEDHIAGKGCGTGSNQEYDVDGSKAYYRGYHGHMTQIAGTNIWYYDYEAEHGAKDGGEIKGYDDVVFVETEQNNYNFFYNNKASRRGDFKHSLSMFVPLDNVTKTKNGTKYYNEGYWMNYPENTGYSLLIYNQKAKAGATKLYEFPFEFTGDFTMPMELVVDLEAGQTYGFEIKRADGSYYSNTGTITANATNQTISENQSSYFGLQTTVAGNYTFRLYYSSSNYRMDVTYPVAVNDYRIVYTDLATWSKTAHTAGWNHPSGVITKNSSATEVKKDTVSFFWTYGSSPAIKYQKCTGTGAGSVTWNTGTEINVSGFSSVLTKKGVYNFIFEQPAGGASISLVKVEPYTGKYYIRTDCAGSSKWVNYRSTDHEMTYSEYTEKNHGYSHYFPHWVTTGQNVKFVIANDYSPCISDTLVEDKGTTIANIITEGNANAGRLNSGNASIRFMWDYKTNKVSRAYISGSTNVSDRFLVLEGDSKMYDENGNPLSISGLNANEINLVDDQNFVYERTIQVNTGAKAKLTAKYNGNVQYFRGGSGSTAADYVELLGGNATGKHTMRIVYDFKTNRLVTAYVPSGTIEENIAIHADLMIVREHQEAGQQLLFNGGSLSEVETVYGVMRFNRWTLNNKEKTGEHTPVGDPKSPYERALYWISFPFDVNLSDVFGFGTYGTHWIIMEYDGAERAKKGYWKDSDGFWKYVTNRTGKVLESGKGYVLGLDLDLMKDDNTDFWAHNIEQVELFFPSASYVSDISATNVTTSAASHVYDPAAHPGHTDDRTYKDSHWNMIGVPSYANYGTTLTSDGSTTVNWATPTNADLPYLYEWNMVDNTYTVQTGTTYPFQSMHAYMVQYHGDLHWSMASATPTPSPIVARRAYAEKPQNAEFRLELQQNGKMVDQTFVNMKDAEEISAGFKFDEDLCKEFNAGKANIYTLIENYLPAAGNTLPMSDQTTVVPVGVKIAANGDYTFSMPDGTEGIGVTLIDNETGIRTSLSALDYTINLSAGTYENRFVLEISPIKQTPTGIENTEHRAQNTDVRKVMIDGVLYIVKDGKMFDAQGTMVK